MPKDGFALHSILKPAHRAYLWCAQEGSAHPGLGGRGWCPDGQRLAASILRIELRLQLVKHVLPLVHCLLGLLHAASHLHPESQSGATAHVAQQDSNFCTRAPLSLAISQ